MRWISRSSGGRWKHISNAQSLKLCIGWKHEQIQKKLDKGEKIDVKKVGRELGARYVVEGSVRKSGNRLRITAQLIDAESGAHVWAERFDRELEDIFDLQDKITESIVHNVMPEISLAEAERATRVPPANLDAWEYYQRGIWHLYRYTREDTEKAREYFSGALERDPSLSLAASFRAI